MGQEIKDAVLEKPIDWQKRRKEILERIRDEEEERRKKIAKATRLQKGWELTIECKRLLIEYDNEWQEEENRREKRRKEQERNEQREKAKAKKAQFEEKQSVKRKNQKITEMLEKIPKTEAEKIEMEIKREEKTELAEMKKILWRKWRGKIKLKELKDRVPKEIDKVDRRLRDIEEKVIEYKTRKSLQLRKQEMKKEEWKRKHKMIGQDTLGMITWLTQFIEDNKYEWGNRRERIQEKIPEEYTIWSGMDEGEMIEIMKAHEEKEKRMMETKI